MLVLTRRVGVSVAIGEDIHLVVMEVEGAKAVRLGVKAPADILIRSKEPFEMVQARSLLTRYSATHRSLR